MIKNPAHPRLPASQQGNWLGASWPKAYQLNLSWLIATCKAAGSVAYQEGFALFYSSRLYNLLLGGARGRELGNLPPDLWPGDRERGLAIMSRTFTFESQRLNLNGSPDRERFWWPSEADQRWMAELHAFEWLRDLREVGSDEARTLASQLIMGWLMQNSMWNESSWAPEVIGRRIVSWLSTRNFWLVGTPETFQTCIIDSLARQACHLLSLATYCSGREPAIWSVINGLIYGSSCLRNPEHCHGLGLSLLGSTLQILPDGGGHVSRCPSLQLRTLERLLEVKAALEAYAIAIPEVLQRAIPQMAAVLRLLRHGDGGLALFNAGRQEKSELIELVLQKAGALPLEVPPEVWGAAGFQRLIGEKEAVVIMDTGGNPARGFESYAYAGALSFEFSIGEDRIVVNCGSSLDPQSSWPRLLATTAAHSSLTVGGRNSSRILAPQIHPLHTICERFENDEVTGITATHDGYSQRFAVTHCRQLGLAKSGKVLEGQDDLYPVPGIPGVGSLAARFTARFHLHPSVEVEAGEDEIILLWLPNGQNWWFEAPGYVTEIEESVYSSDGVNLVDTMQLVIHGHTDNPLYWRFFKQD